MPRYSSAEITRNLAAAVRFFQRHRLRYALIGGMALSVWGRPRTTLDLDFLVQVDEEKLLKIREWVLKEGLKIDNTWVESNPLMARVQLRLRFGQVMVDMLIPRDAHDRNAFHRRKRKNMGRGSYWLIAPEDFILQKLKVGRPRDFEDAVTVLERLRGELDTSYLMRWARRLAITGELKYILEL